MRDTIADMVTNRDWIVLRAEFEAGLFGARVSGKVLLRCIDSRFTTVESWSTIF
jgi:hypothetical protein